MAKQIMIPCGGVICVTINEQAGESLGHPGIFVEAGIESTGLKEPCPICEQFGGRCGCIQADRRYDLSGESIETLITNAQIDGLESLILACAAQGVDIESEAFKEAVRSAVDAIGNHD